MKQVLTNCHLIDGRGGQAIDNAVVEIHDDTIHWTGPASDWEGDSTIGVRDMQGAYVLPGLWDMHIHLSMTVLKEGASPPTPAGAALFSYRRALAFLDAGITTLRLVGSGQEGIDFALRDGIAQGEYWGPRLLTAGQGLSSTGGHGYDGQTPCDGPYQFRRAARERLAAGADLIKIMVTGGMGGRYETHDALQTLPDEVKAAVEVAHNAQKHVAAHIASPQAAVMGVDAGIDTVEHGYTLDAASLTYMAENGVTYVPTLVVSHDLDYWEKLRVASWSYQKLRIVQEPHRQAVKTAIQLGVPMAIGTDVPTAHMDGTIVTVREMELLEELGAMPSEVITWATSVPARVAGLGGTVGELVPGQKADLIAVLDDPEFSVKALRDVKLVMTNGRITKDLLTSETPVTLPDGFFGDHPL